MKKTVLSFCLGLSMLTCAVDENRGFIGKDALQELVQTGKCKNCDFQGLGLEFKAAFMQARKNHKDLDVSGSNFSGVNFSGLDLSHVDFSKTNLTGAKLVGSRCSWSNFFNADFSHANCENTSFFYANLNDSIVENTDFTDASFCGSQMYDLKGLETADFSKARLAGLDTDRATKAIILAILEQNSFSLFGYR